MNVLLNDAKREYYAPVIETLRDLCPELIARKIERANVQQAFTFDAVLKYAKADSKILCVGSHEDTACEALLKKQLNITAIDPEINYSLEDFYGVSREVFDIVFSTSVIEHVKDDEFFLDLICKFLKPGGYGVLTCDFRDGYTVGDTKPGEDFRLYTKADLLIRLPNVLKANNCALVGEVNFDGEPDFSYGSCLYSFATYTFRKEG